MPSKKITDEYAKSGLELKKVIASKGGLGGVFYIATKDGKTETAIVVRVARNEAAAAKKAATEGRTLRGLLGGGKFCSGVILFRERKPFFSIQVGTLSPRAAKSVMKILAELERSLQLLKKIKVESFDASAEVDTDAEAIQAQGDDFEINTASLNLSKKDAAEVEIALSVATQHPERFAAANAEVTKALQQGAAEEGLEEALGEHLSMLKQAQSNMGLQAFQKELSAFYEASLAFTSMEEGQDIEGELDEPTTALFNASIVASVSKLVDEMVQINDALAGMKARHDRMPLTAEEQTQYALRQDRFQQIVGQLSDAFARLGALSGQSAPPSNPHTQQ